MARTRCTARTRSAMVTKDAGSGSDHSTRGSDLPVVVSNEVM
jgi:hypothetical protein